MGGPGDDPDRAGLSAVLHGGPQSVIAGPIITATTAGRRLVEIIHDEQLALYRFRALVARRTAADVAQLEDEARRRRDLYRERALATGTPQRTSSTAAGFRSVSDDIQAGRL